MYQVRSKAFKCFILASVDRLLFRFTVQVLPSWPLSSYLANVRFTLILLKFHEISFTQSRYSDDISRKEDEKNSLFEKLNGFNSTLTQ